MHLQYGSPDPPARPVVDHLPDDHEPDLLGLRGRQRAALRLRALHHHESGVS